MTSLPRLNLHLRLQHGVLTLAALSALATGLGISFDFVPGDLRFDLWYRIHLWAGLAAGGVVVYHLLYLMVRGYVEGMNLPAFPLVWRKEDWAEIRGQLLHVWGGGPRPDAGRFRASQKALYWGTALLVAALFLTGIAISYWEFFSSSSLLSALSALAHLHRGLALIFLAVTLWHLYGTLTWAGAWNPQWTWLTGSISGDLAKEKVPGFFGDWLVEEKRREGLHRKSGEEDEEETVRDRVAVEEDLQEGNRLAKEEKFVDALYHYRRALERYPGYSQARYNMAVVLRKMGERAMAVENFRQFLQDDPFHPLARRAQEFIAEIEKEESQ